ncbi:MAG TPA: hypothetical protein VK145_01060 [Candidatus Nanoarchaeia archaeon]|nr:hypothetical protein [Candidatus Nanoarchaeia archaeon]
MNRFVTLVLVLLSLSLGGCNIAWGVGEVAVVQNSIEGAVVKNFVLDGTMISTAPIKTGQRAQIPLRSLSSSDHMLLLADVYSFDDKHIGTVKEYINYTYTYSLNSGRSYRAAPEPLVIRYYTPNVPVDKAGRGY